MTVMTMKKIKIGILTFWSSINYGAYLQAYALVNRLNQEADIDAEIIQFKMNKEVEYYQSFQKPQKNFIKWIYNVKRNRILQKQGEKLPLSSQLLISDAIPDFISWVQGKYDVIIAGSDEIWRVDGMRGYPTPYFLFGGLSARKLSYAASGRVGFSQLAKEELDQLRKTFEEYEYIGVRDTATYEMVKMVLNRSDTLHLNLDPTFIFDFQPDRANGKRILQNRFHVNIDKCCIGVMYSEQKPMKPIISKYIQSEANHPIQIIALYEWFRGSPNDPKLTPLEWIDVISVLDGVVSMYFHGICFSIISGTPFYAIESRAKSNSESKIFDLLQTFHMTDAYSLGVKDAFESGKLRSFVNGCVKQKKRLESKGVIELGRQEFQQFLECIRSKGSNAVQS